MSSFKDEDFTLDKWKPITPEQFLQALHQEELVNEGDHFSMEMYTIKGGWFTVFGQETHDGNMDPSILVYHKEEDHVDANQNVRRSSRQLCFRRV